MNTGAGGISWGLFWFSNVGVHGFVLLTLGIHPLVCEHLWHFDLVLFQRHASLVPGPEMPDFLRQPVNEVKPSVSPLDEADQSDHK